MRQLIRAIGLRFAHTFGTRVTDSRTGQSLGRALFVPWRGKIHVIGLSAAAHPIFVPQKRLTYWKQEIGFIVHPPVDFPRERSTSAGESADR